MLKKLNPLYLIIGIVGVAFVVWLFTSMARTSEANRILITLTLCFALVGVAGLLSVRGERRRERQQDGSHGSARAGEGT